HVICPPSKKIAFNSKLINNDGYLASLIAEGEEISMEDATREVSKFVSHIQLQIKKSGLYTLPGVGSFVMKQGLLEFEPDLSINYLLQSYALPEIMISPIKRQDKSDKTFKHKNRMAIQQKPSPVSPPSTKDKPASTISSGPILGVLFLLFSISGTYLIFYNQKNISHGSLNPIEWINYQEEIISDSSIVALGAEEKTEGVDTSAQLEEEKSADAPEDNTSRQSTDFGSEEKQLESLDVNQSFSEQEDAAKKSGGSQILDTHTKRYFVIVGGFKDPDKALLLRDKLEGEGVDSKILQPAKGNTLYRVSVADYENFEEALQKSNELKSKFGDAIWVLVYDLGK
ncbi:MAG: SPOR domain-containing protein, partial [Cytophagales bacterium]|nr:SPOR domain-containing protein [Cytophagales bacterium]